MSRLVDEFAPPRNTAGDEYNSLLIPDSVIRLMESRDEREASVLLEKGVKNREGQRIS